MSAQLAIDFPPEPVPPPMRAVPAPGYFNTTRERGEELRHARSVAARQDALVLQIFGSAPRDSSLGPSQVHVRGGGDAVWLLTSVRRSMTNLASGDAPRLIKTADKRRGAHGRPESLWRLA